MKKATFKYQSRDYKFPKTAYIGCVSINDSKNKRHSLCLTRVFEDLYILRRYVLFVIDDLTDSNKEITPIYEGSVIKCNYSRLFPLKRSHWGKRQALEMDLFQKFRNDVNIMKFWKMSEILVTPDGEIDGVEFFSFCISLFKGTPKKDIDLYIKNSNQVVDVRAKNGAFYTLDKPVKINWSGNSKKNTWAKITENYIN